MERVTNEDLRQLAREREQRKQDKEQQHSRPREDDFGTPPPPPRRRRTATGVAPRTPSPRSAPHLAPRMIMDAAGVPGLVVVKNFWSPEQCTVALSSIDTGKDSWEGGFTLREPGRQAQHFGPFAWNYKPQKNGAWLVDSSGRTKHGPPLFVVKLLHDARALRIPEMSTVRDDEVCSMAMRYDAGVGGLPPHVDSRGLFGRAVFSVTLEGEGTLRMSLGGTQRTVELSPGTLFVMTGASRFTWKHELPARGVKSRRTALVVQPVNPRMIKHDGRCTVSFR